MIDNTKPTATKLAPDTTQPRRYFRVQIKAWTAFDPSRADLTDIANEIDRGTAFLTGIEVSKVVDDLNGIDDPEVRRSFENIIAAERILQNLSDLPQSLRERLSAALSANTALPNEDKSGRGGRAA
jgi:hypothetical protein